MTARIFAAFLVVILVALRLPAEAPPDAEATKLLVGTWDCHDESGTKECGFTFRANGTFSSHAVFQEDDKDLRVDIEGKWKVENGALVEELTKCTVPELAPVGLTTRDELLSITKTTFSFKTEQGKEHTYTRK